MYAKPTLTRQTVMHLQRSKKFIKLWRLCPPSQWQGPPGGVSVGVQWAARIQCSISRVYFNCGIQSASAPFGPVYNHSSGAGGRRGL